jgi:hypothetical protein
MQPHDPRYHAFVSRFVDAVAGEALVSTLRWSRHRHRRFRATAIETTSAPNFVATSSPSDVDQLPLAA